MARRASQCYYKILLDFMQRSNNAKIQPVFATLIKRYGLVKPTLGKMLVHYLCMENNIDGALKFINELRINNLKFSFPVDVIGMLTAQGRPLDAYRLVMGSQNDLSSIDVVDCSVLVDGLCKEGLFDLLERNNISPSDITYGTLIDALVREGFLLDAQKLFDKMIAKGIKPNTHIYISLIDGYCKLGNVKEALRLFYDLENYSLKPEKFAVSAMIYGFSFEGNMEGALQFYIGMQGNGVSPDFLGFLYLVRGLCSKGRMEEARSVKREMLQDESILELLNKVDDMIETESVESFLVHLCELGNIQGALTILNEIGSMFFPYKRIYASDTWKPMMCDEDIRTTPPNVLSSIHQTDFDCLYSQMTSLCSQGDLQGASTLVKAMISSFAKK